MKGGINNRFGFTILEVMVVVVIIGILVTAAVTSFRTTSLRQQRDAASNEISSLLYQARSVARSTSIPAVINIINVATAPGLGSSIQAVVGSPVNWNQILVFGPNTNYTGVGLVGGAMGPFTISPRGMVTPAAFALNVRDSDFATNGETVNVNLGLLGDITITGP